MMSWLKKWLRLYDKHLVEPNRSLVHAPDLPAPEEPTPVVDGIDVLRTEYEALARGPSGKRRKRHSVRALAQKHGMTVAEVTRAVRKQ